MLTLPNICRACCQFSAKPLSKLWSLYFLLAENALRNQYGFLTTEVTTYKTGCLVNFLPCMAIYICSRPGTLWSDSLTSLPCLWSILRDWMQNRPTLTVWQHIVLWQRGPLSQPACCQAKSYPHKTHPVIYQWYSTYINQQHLHDLTV